MRKRRLLPLSTWENYKEFSGSPQRKYFPLRKAEMTISIGFSSARRSLGKNGYYHLVRQHSKRSWVAEEISRQQRLRPITIKMKKFSVIPLEEITSQRI